jgi:hypothetical protein
MEVAGVVLGAFPLVLYALDRYEEACDSVTQAWAWKSTIQTIRNQILMQKLQLDRTLGVLGSVTTMQDVEIALKIAHPNHWQHLMSIITRMNDTIIAISECLYPDAKGPVRLQYHPTMELYTH